VKVIAPGKLVLTGAYAVLGGAPAIVAAIDRYAVADVSLAGLGGDPLQEVDVRALQEGGRKLGLGSSAAALVALLGARAMARGEDPRSAAVRARILREAREAHSRQQGGGSGVDIAASVHGGVLRYEIASDGEPKLRALDLPPRLQMAAYDSGHSVRTSHMRARFDASHPSLEASGLLTRLAGLAMRAATAAEAGDTPSFIRAAFEFGRALATLGEACDAPIVPPAFADLASVAENEGAAFLPSGAGGGDVGVWLGLAPPSSDFTSRAQALSMRPLAIGIDRGGLRTELSP
jgi:phosphomevalonate kinase